MGLQRGYNRVNVLNPTSFPPKKILFYIILLSFPFPFPSLSTVRVPLLFLRKKLIIFSLSLFLLLSLFFHISSFLFFFFFSSNDFYSWHESFLIKHQLWETTQYQNGWRLSPRKIRVRYRSVKVSSRKNAKYIPGYSAKRKGKITEVGTVNEQI